MWRPTAWPYRTGSEAVHASRWPWGEAAHEAPTRRLRRWRATTNLLHSNVLVEVDASEGKLTVKSTSDWMSIRRAAELLGFAPVSLRRAIERNARRAIDGGIEARFDGLIARKLGRNWRVQLSSAWHTSGRA